MCAPARSCNRSYIVSVETILGVGLCVLLLFYLTYALLRPEKF